MREPWGDRTRPAAPFRRLFDGRLRACRGTARFQRRFARPRGARERRQVRRGTPDGVAVPQLRNLGNLAAKAARATAPVRPSAGAERLTELLGQVNDTRPARTRAIALAAQCCDQIGVSAVQTEQLVVSRPGGEPDE